MIIIGWIGLGILIGNALFFGVLVIVHAVETRREKKESGWHGVVLVGADHSVPAVDDQDDVRK